MYSYHDILFFIILSAIGLLFGSIVAIAAFYAGTGKKMTYRRAEGEQVYAVCKYKRLRGGGAYEVSVFSCRKFLRKKLNGVAAK